MNIPNIQKPIFSCSKLCYMKLILAIPAAGLLLTGAASLQKPAIAPADFRPSAIEVSSPLRDRAMWTDKSLVYKGEALQLHFSMPHAPFLGVIDPAGKFYYVVFPAGSSVGNLRPLVTSEAFVAMNTLSINTAKFKADPYTSGVLDNQPVFTTSGTYRFLLGENLHTDDERFIEIVKVNYRHKKRPGKKAIAYASL